MRDSAINRSRREQSFDRAVKDAAERNPRSAISLDDEDDLEPDDDEFDVDDEEDEDLVDEDDEPTELDLVSARLEAAAAQAPTITSTGMIRFTPRGMCRCCGCTDEHGCPGGCVWAEPNLCSRCALGNELGG